MTCINECGLFGLVSMGSYNVDYNLLNLIMANWDNEKSEVNMIVNERQLSFTLKLTYVARLTGLPYKVGETVNMKALLTNEDKLYFEINHSFHMWRKQFLPLL